MPTEFHHEANIFKGNYVKKFSLVILGNCVYNILREMYNTSS